MKQIKGFPSYSIDETGTKVLNTITNRVLVIGDQLIDGKPTGYKYVTLCNPKYEWKRVSIHRMVALTYIENHNNLPEVNHIDGNKGNNAVNNLEWVTHQQNIQHSYDNGRITPKGEQSKRFGCKASLDTKNKQSLSKMGKNHPKFTGVYMVFYKPYYSSIEAYKATNICSKTILRRCKKGQPGTDFYFIPK